ncbi:sugar ABC transporter permease [[Mycoplasma] phocae]|uniref:Sugar ABC transporter permease n=1 Tax=[Mycoplasma] phocae TaxID=142651 RepID=A0A2Z5IPF1_9BACT|nr:sugar ABC transporter permease [[Mycoplasma] phocae]AXE60559.1 sugar ABC transporter permease [[Mycoplasma] phocae]
MKTYFWRKYRLKNTGLALSVLNSRISFWKPFLLMVPSLITILLLTVIPFILVIIGSFRVQVGFTRNAVIFGFGNFQKLFTDNTFIIAIRNSLVFALVALPISLSISLLISSAISQVIKKWARGFWQTVFFLPYVTSAIAVSLAFAFIFKSQGGLINKILLDLGLTKNPINFLDDGSSGSWNAFFVILIRGIWGNLAFQVLLLTTAMLSVNQDLYKSASIDGASSTKQFFTITLPAISKTISFLFTIGIIGGIKVFPLALFNNDPAQALQYNGQSIILYIFNYARLDFARAGAASIILFLMGFALSFGLRKLVFVTFRVTRKLGEKNVVNKIKNASIVRKSLFKI